MAGVGGQSVYSNLFTWVTLNKSFIFLSSGYLICKMGILSFTSHIACGILVPRPGIEPFLPPAVEGWNLNHWIPGKCLSVPFPAQQTHLPPETHREKLTLSFYSKWGHLRMQLLSVPRELQGLLLLSKRASLARSNQVWFQVQATDHVWSVMLETQRERGMYLLEKCVFTIKLLRKYKL